jgi:nucleoid DNA-binding protein/LysM repeat protein
MKDKITYALLQERVAGAAGVSRKEANRLLKEMAAAVGTGLAVDGKVNLVGLGRFSLKLQSARRGRNPRTGESIDIPEKNRVHFLPEVKLRRHINRLYEQMPMEPAPRPKTPAVPLPESGPSPAAASGGRAGLIPPPAKAIPVPTTIKNPPPPTETVPDKPAVEVSTVRFKPENNHQAVAQAAQPVNTPKPLPEEEISDQRKKPVAAAVILLLLLVAAVFFLWPRQKTPAPPAIPQPVPVVAKTGTYAVPPAPTTTATLPMEPTPAAVPAETPAASVVSTAPAPLTTHTVATGDSLWKISDDVYNYAYFWPIIFQENHTILKHPDTLKVGLQLEIPVFEGQVGRLTESNFQQLADGYFQVYQVYHHNRHPRAPYYLWVAYQLQAYWVPADELVAVKPDDLKFIQRLKGKGLIH